MITVFNNKNIKILHNLFKDTNEKYIDNLNEYFSKEEEYFKNSKYIRTEKKYANIKNKNEQYTVVFNLSENNSISINKRENVFIKNIRVSNIDFIDEIILEVDNCVYDKIPNKMIEPLQYLYCNNESNIIPLHAFKYGLPYTNWNNIIIKLVLKPFYSDVKNNNKLIMYYDLYNINNTNTLTKYYHSLYSSNNSNTIGLMDDYFNMDLQKSIFYIMIETDLLLNDTIVINCKRKNHNVYKTSDLTQRLTGHTNLPNNLLFDLVLNQIKTINKCHIYSISSDSEEGKQSLNFSNIDCNLNINKSIDNVYYDNTKLNIYGIQFNQLKTTHTTDILFSQ
jgi:hypothetical protein